MKKIISALLGKRIKEKLRFKLLLYKVKHKQNKALNRIKGKEKITVAFFLIHDSVWKYELLYQLMVDDPRFEPVVLVCPYVTSGEDVMRQDMVKAYSGFKERGYKVIKALKEDGSWLDVKKEIKPDIIFFTNPHKLTKDQYYISNYLDYLTCYVPYNFGNAHLLKMFHDKDFHNILWRLFCETIMHKQFSIDVARNKGVNVRNTGFPGTDLFLQQDAGIESNWKNNNFTKIIWAPHHTIDDNKSFLSFSSFLSYHDYFFQLLEKYSNQIEIAFKPHPLLRLKLYEHEGWGREKTDEYYRKWNDLKNGSLSDGDYIGLFLTSDAMIHDSGSFLIEYLYTGKPVLRTDRDDSITDRLNDFAKMAYQVHYIARKEREIESFIENVINNVDTKKTDRNEFKNKYLLPPNGKSASENIFDEIKSIL